MEVGEVLVLHLEREKTFCCSLSGMSKIEPLVCRKSSITLADLNHLK